MYDITFWEARRIIRGYQNRGKIFRQLLAENVFASTFAFRGSEGKTVRDLFPSIFAEDDEDLEPYITEEECNDLQAEIAAYNAQLEQKSSVE